MLYLTTFAALRLYSLLPPALAFALLAAIAIFSALLAVMQDALILAAFGAGGGFLAPILASTGQGSHVMLFGYYLLLNLGIAGIAFFKSWRSLNIMAWSTWSTWCPRSSPTFAGSSRSTRRSRCCSAMRPISASPPQNHLAGGMLRDIYAGDVVHIGDHARPHPAPDPAP